MEGCSMIELSPAAQAVLDAAIKVAESPDAEAIAAAALLAAADQIENLYCDCDMEDSPGIVFALRQLMIIANELEAQ
jgi:hypothetical protein